MYNDIYIAHCSNVKYTFNQFKVHISINKVVIYNRFCKNNLQKKFSENQKCFKIYLKLITVFKLVRIIRVIRYH